MNVGARTKAGFLQMYPVQKQGDGPVRMHSAAGTSVALGNPPPFSREMGNTRTFS